MYVPSAAIMLQYSRRELANPQRLEILQESSRSTTDVAAIGVRDPTVQAKIAHPGKSSGSVGGAPSVNTSAYGP